MLLTPKKPEVTDQPLQLGDYVTVIVPDLDSSEADRDEQGDRRENFIQRAQRQRSELFRRIQEQGKLIDVRRRGAA
jgi:hypothetical protein